MSYTFRLAFIDELSALQELAVKTFTGAYAEFNTKENMDSYLAENFSRERLKEEICAGEIFAGVQDNRIVAYTKLVIPEPGKIPDHHPIEIARLYTDTSVIGQGIGRKMLEAIIAEAHRRECDSVCLDVWQKNFRAINFYQREGFRICGTTHFVLGDDMQDDFVMLRKLTTA